MDHGKRLVENPVVPDARSKQGRKPEKRKAQTDPLRVDQWMVMQPDSSWSLMTLRESTKGTIKVELLHRRIWVWDGEETRARQWHLLIRRDPDSKSDYKYSLSKAAADTPVQRLAFMQGQRYWIERTFEDGKSEIGMADYQMRGWLGWQHHMALVMMAMLFMLQERCLHQETHPLLSCSDIETLLAHFLPKRDVTVDEVVRQNGTRTEPYRCHGPKDFPGVPVEKTIGRRLWFIVESQKTFTFKLTEIRSNGPKVRKSHRISEQDQRSLIDPGVIDEFQPVCHLTFSLPASNLTK